MVSEQPTYDVDVTREGRWWMIGVPAIDGLTQARRVGEIEDMARSLIAVTLDVPLSGVVLGRVSIAVGDFGDVSEDVALVSHLKAEAATAEALAAKHQRVVAQGLVAVGVPLRDVGALLGVSFQRVGQLVNSRC